MVDYHLCRSLVFKGLTMFFIKRERERIEKINLTCHMKYQKAELKSIITNSDHALSRWISRVHLKKKVHAQIISSFAPSSFYFFWSRAPSLQLAFSNGRSPVSHWNQQQSKVDFGGRVISIVNNVGPQWEATTNPPILASQGLPAPLSK
jgi:hypothetical protein